jgi:nitroimidazol reductase NimA-like FMN-containing flavoprotein (pyridoxamine 5'-phosphate oxidase superfamily)
MDETIVKQKIFEFLNKNELGVISTVHSNENTPESAVIGFGNNESLEIVFGTSNSTRKYMNLKSNPNVSFVIGWSSEAGTIQYEGSANELTKEEAMKYGNLLIEKNVNNKKYLDSDKQKYFLVKTKWIRFLDNSSIHPEIYELSF